MNRLLAATATLALLATMAGCAHQDPMHGRASSDLPPGPLGPIKTEGPRHVALCDGLDVSADTSRTEIDTEHLGLKFTNSGSEACVIRGYPVLTLKDGGDNEIGDHATAYLNGAAREIVLQPGQAATADVRFPKDKSGCQGGATQMAILLPSASDEVSIRDSHPYCKGWSVSSLQAPQ